MHAQEHIMMSACAETPKRVNIHHPPPAPPGEVATITGSAAEPPISRHGSMGAPSVLSSAASSTHGSSTHGAVAPASSALQLSSANKRLYRAGENKWVTRDIASLDFLLGIPLAAEQEIVSTGWQLQLKRDDEELSLSSHNNNNNNDRAYEQQQRDVRLLDANTKAGTAWWGKWIQTGPTDGTTALSNNKPNGSSDHTSEPAELEGPTKADAPQQQQQRLNNNNPFLGPLATGNTSSYAPPGRRLEGDPAVRVQIPLTSTTDTAFTKQKTIARQAALREWELQTAYGSSSQQQPPLLDGRLFFSCDSSYPVSVFSVIRYEPRKEEAAIRRKKLEAIGGGGSQFVLPKRDWRGISYRALLPRSTGDDDKRDDVFNRFVRDDDDSKAKTDDGSTGSVSSEDSDVYVPGLLDDPEMVLGRHKSVIVGDAVTGPIVSSSIQFVKPAILKAELNKQFRERFGDWEPPKSARKYIGAKVIQGNYVLMDPTEEHDDQSYERRRNRQGSVGSFASISDEGPQEKVIRMPPSLTLSKIRSLKRQALLAAVKAKLQIGTVALACVYFERLCLDCRVDKSNRRLTFASCLLLASKLNEPNVSLVTCQDSYEENDEDDISKLLFLIKPNKRSNKMFASLLLFFTQDWCLSLKQLFDTEWAVFAALGFSLHASPSQVAFHFKRLMKTLEWSALDYLGPTMYKQWQDTLAEEEERRAKRERRRETRRKRKEEQLLNLHIEIEKEYRRKSERHAGRESAETPERTKEKERSSDAQVTKKKIGIERRIKLFNRFAIRRTVSQERMADTAANNENLASTAHEAASAPRRSTLSTLIHFSPSMPSLATTNSHEPGVLAIDVPALNHDDPNNASSIGSQNSDNGGIQF